MLGYFFLNIIYNMFRAAPAASQFIPLKKVQVKPEAQVTYNPTTEIQARFHFPQYLGFMDPRQSHMEGDLKMTGRGHPIPNPRAGFTSLIRDSRLQSGDGIATIEEILDLNVLTAQWWGWTSNESIRNKRSLFEGQELNSSQQESLYYTGDTNWRGAGKRLTANQTATTVQIESPLYTGIMTGKVFPLLATSGLRLLLTLESAERALSFKTGAFGVANKNTARAELLGAGKAPTLSQLPAVNPPTPKAGAANETFSIAVDGVERDPDVPSNDNPYSIGDRVYVITATGTNQGVIVAIKNGAALDAAEGGALGDDILALEICWDVGVGAALPHAFAVGDPIIVDPGDRMNGITPTANEDVDANVEAAMAEKVGYTLDNFQYIVGQVSPPEGYVQALTQQIQSDKGLAMDFKTFSLYKFNLTSVNGLSTQLIPTNAMRAYSCLSVPIPQDVYTQIEADSLAGVVDGAKNYQYVLGGNLIPDRPIELERYTLNPPRTEALHLLEAEKALVNCGYAVRNLQRVADRFIIGRGFSRYGQVADLNDRSLSLRVLYQGAEDQKIYNHYICHLRRMTVRQGKVEAF